MTAAAFGGILAVLLLLAPPAHAVPPANDAFAAAIAITGEPGEIAGENVDATREQGEPQHGEDGRTSVWYRWTAPFTGRVVFETCTATFDTLLAAYSGTTLTTLRQLATNDDFCDTGSQIEFAVTEGSVYHVAVDGFDGEQGRFTLRWRRFIPPPPPRNDSFAAAFALSGLRGRMQGTTVGATGQQGEPSVLRATSVWYRWRAPRTIPIVFSTCGAGFDSLLGAFRGTAVNALTQLAVNDDGCRLASRLTLQARSGQVYHLAVAALGRPGTFQLRWEPQRCRVPPVVGLMLGQARRAIARAGCRVGPVRRARSELPPRGVILAQWPNPGTQLQFGGAVHLLVSLGPR